MLWSQAVTATKDGAINISKYDHCYDTSLKDTSRWIALGDAKICEEIQ